MNSTTLKIAVLTDLHAFPGKQDDRAPSWIALGEDQGNARSNPFAGLNSLISTHGLEADLVVCCGDMGDKASPEGQQYVWREVTALKSALKAQMAVGTAGNHDLDSRFQYTQYDARGQIQSLDPPFPISDEMKWMEYWSKNFTKFDVDGARIVLLNTAAYHGYTKADGNPEYHHGRVSDRTIDKLVSSLKIEGERSTNILICHHHPFKNDMINIADYSQMENGDRLINELVGSRTGPWLIVHGHKHMPRVFYGPGGNSAPAVFSAGSFSAKLYPEYADLARNEFYIIEIQVPAVLGAATSVKGRIKTWQWSYGNGWVKPRAGQGLGPSAAFGARAEVGEIASEVAQKLLETHKGQSVDWREVIKIKPNIEFLIPEDLNLLLHLLEKTYSVRPVADYQTGEIAEVQVA